nr:TlpA disulfide reductase family protein [uncultured Chitinophaga sp.]
MKQSITISLLLILAAISPLKAQKLNIGDKCPDISLTTLLNHHSKNGNLLSDFADKPLIIDFWFSSCAPCLDFIPRLDSLQKKYQNRFNILLVTYENEEKVKMTMQKNPQIGNVKSPIATAIETTTSLMKLFPHTMEPHEIWIGKDGIVKAITSHYDVTPSNIEKFISDLPLDIPEKKEITDPKISMGGQPLLVTDQEFSAGKGKLLYVYFGKGDPKIPGISMASFNDKGGESRILCQNCPVHTLYETAYKRKGRYTPIKVVNKLSDTTRFVSDGHTQKNIFCFEVVAKDTSEGKIKQIMKRELDNFFGLRSSLTQELVPCYVLSSISTNDKFKSKDDLPSSHEMKKNNIVVKNIGIFAVLRNKLYNNLPYNVINETGYNGNIDVVIPHSTDIDQIKKGLNKYGLDINLEMRNEDRIILEDM